jgi:hypothetical protein
LHHFFSVSLFSLWKWDHNFIKSNKTNYTRWSKNGYLKRQKRFNWKKKHNDQEERKLMRQAEQKPEKDRGSK